MAQSAARIINIADAELVPRPAEHAPAGARAALYDVKMARLSALLGARHLGYNVTAVAAGKRAFPFHNHRINEEMFFILAGSGEVRIGDEIFPLKAGDLLACPPGGPETAHQIINSGSEELRYLSVSTRLYPEVCEYPDSEKFGIYAEFAADEHGQKKQFRHVGRVAQNIDYWDGE